MEDDLQDEIIHFVSLIKEMEEVEDKNGTHEDSPEVYMYLAIVNQDIRQTFPNVYIALRIYFFMMVSNRNGEKSFSKLKRIKHEVRSTTSQKWLNWLSLMSIEHEVLRGLKYAEIINDFDLQKVRFSDSFLLIVQLIFGMIFFKSYFVFILKICKNLNYIIK